MHKLFTDGGSRGNPGPAGIGFILFNDSELVHFDAKHLGNATNNQAEYAALLFGLKTCKKQGIKNIECYLDSELVVKQLNGIYKIKNESIKPLYLKIRTILDELDIVTFTHVPREQNKFADKLVNIALDAHLNKPK